MNTKLKKVLIGFAALLVAVALIAIAPVSRIVYAIYDANRTNTILKQLEAEAGGSQGSNPGDAEVNTFHKQAYLGRTQETVDGKTVEKIDLLVLTSESGYELSYYERVETATTSYTSEYFHMTGSYTREGNVLTVEPGIGVLAQSKDGVSYVYYNAQYLTAEEAGGDKTRDEIYDMKYSSRSIALMKDGSFVVGGESDSAEELGAPEGRHVYTEYTEQGRKTYKTLVLQEGGVYFVYSHATNSSNAEQTTGCLFGFGSYEIKDSDKGIAPDEAVPEETYDIVTGEVGLGYMYANNNGSHMHFDLQTGDAFSSWLATSLNATSPTFYVTESGFTLKLGALKTTVDPWGLYIPAADSGEDGTDEEPVTGNIRLEVETSVEGKPFILEFNTDGTLRSGWTNYEETMVDGTWSIADGALVLDMAYGAAITENGDGSLEITVNYGQMGEKVYTLTAAQYDALKSIELPVKGVELQIPSSVEDKPFVLNLNADGTLLTGWTNYEQTLQEGTWAITDGNLVLNMAYGSTVTGNAEGGLDITVNYGQMGEKVYTMTADQLAVLKSIELPVKGVTLEVETSVEGKPFVLELNPDGTLRSGWTNYEETMVDGTWTITNGTLVLDMAYGATVAGNAEGGLDITVSYGQMGEKVYTMTAAQFDTLKSIELPAQGVELEVETSVEGMPFILYLNADGTLRTGWTNYEQTLVDGIWTISGGNLVLEMGAYTAAVSENAEGGLDITVNYGQMGEKVYTMTAAQFDTLKSIKASAGKDIKLEIETSVAGMPFVLELNADGTLRTGWTNYEQTMVDGTWTVTDGALVLTMGSYSASVTENAEGGLDITVDYGQMGEKTYTMTAEQADAILN